MTKKIGFFFFVLLISTQLIGQPKNHWIDLRLGTGLTLLGSGDMVTFNVENELNYHLGKYFTLAPSFTMGRSNVGVSETASFAQGNFNLFLSPLGSHKRIDFRIGGGYSLYRVSDAYMSGMELVGDEYVDDYIFSNRTSSGFSIIIENSVQVTDRFLIGFKLYTQPYNNGDLNSGILMTMGLKI